MNRLIVFSFMLVCFCKYGVSLPGPMVYVVTPAPRTEADEARSAPFYYHNWMRRMDPPMINATTTTTKKPETPDLIFAEFESGNRLKSIRNLLEKEKVQVRTTTTTTTMRPIYIPENKPIYVPEKKPIYTADNDNFVTQPTPINMKDEEKRPEPDRTDYFSLYNNLYNEGEAHVPAYLPSTTTPTTMTTTTTTAIPNVENIWHIIDSEKKHQYSGGWEEEPIANDTENDGVSDNYTEEKKTEDENIFDNNFAFPGFSTNPGNGAENESRAIRTEPNIRFPYVNLKPFQMKTQMKPVSNSLMSSKKGNNMYTSLDNFREVKNPVRGEAEDVASMPNRQPIDRYNPAQPYLPSYGSKSKQSSPISPPVRTVSNLVPPPPPPPPRVTDNDFPALSNYEPFPPYPPSAPPSSPPAPAPAPKPPVTYLAPMPQDDSNIDLSGDFDNGPPVDSGYRYKPPSPPVPSFLPTALPPTMPKPFSGYSYNKPPVDDKPQFNGYHYKKPEPPPAPDSPSDVMDDQPDFQGYHYKKPEPPPADDTPPSYGPDSPPSYGPDSPPSYGPDSPPSYGPDSHSYEPKYPELIFDKHKGMKGGDDTKDAGMVPPPPPRDMKPDMGMDHGGPMDDPGFPHDFPGDFKYHHDFDDHDFHHHEHHEHTTTTEMPRVNRYSYYYLGKKLYYFPLYFSVYFIVYVGALIIKAVLRHKIVYPNSWRPNDTTATFFTKRSIDPFDLSNEKLHEITGKITHAIAVAGEKYLKKKSQ